jgi:glutathione reductase (NADPH)
MPELDVVVIGTGAAGAWAATLCAEGGLSVAIADRLPYGGTCKQRGCDPKRVLVAASEVVCRAQSLAGEGVGGRIHIEWSDLMRRKREYVGGMPERTEQGLRDAGVTLFHGEARFVSADTVEVCGERLHAGYVVVATGSRPRSLGIPGEDLLVHSDGFMDLDELPRRIVFVGGGYISFEMAALARRAGVEVTILHRSGRVLERFDPALTDILVRRYGDMGIDVRLDAPLEAVERRGPTLVARAAGSVLETDMVVHGAGRVPDLDALDLAVAGVEADGRGILVDEMMRSISNPRVFAAGDAASRGLPLTPPASREAGALARTILGDPTPYDPYATASVVFSDPPLAAVGMTTDEARGRDDVEVVFKDMSSWFTQWRVGFDRAGATIVRERDGGRLLGAHVLGVNAEEVINVFALAVRHGLTAEQVGEAVWAYPTAGSDIGYMVG